MMMDGIGGMGGMQAGNIEAMRGQQFQRDDLNADGGIDQSEMEGVLDRFTQSGLSVDSEDLFAEYDGDEDGVLNEEEMASAMDSLHDELKAEGKGPGMGGRPPMDEAAGAYAANSTEDMTGTLMDLLSASEDDEDEENGLLQQLLDQQQSGTVSAYSPVDLLA